MLHGLHGDSAVQCQRAGDDAALHAPLRDLPGGDGGRHLVCDILHSGQYGHLGALHAQRAGHRQRVLHDADLGLYVRSDVDSGIGNHDKPALVLKNTALADETAASLRNQARLLIQDSPREVGGLEYALHGDVGLALPHQLYGGLGGVQLRAVEIDDLILGGVLVHLPQQGQNFVLLAQQGAVHHAPAVGVDHGTEGGLVMGVGQDDALFVFMRQDIGFQFFEIREHIRSSYSAFPFCSHFSGTELLYNPLSAKTTKIADFFCAYLAKKLAIGGNFLYTLP